MITFFASPKPFIGHIGIIQRNAIASWRQLGENVQIILFGDEVGIEDAARDYRTEHHPIVAKNSHGTPLLSDMLRQAETASHNSIMCFINSDIVLMRDFLDAVGLVKTKYPKFLMIGQCWNLDVTEPLDLKSGWEKDHLISVKTSGTRRDAYSIDYFVFPRQLYGEIPDFAIGRGWFDHWLVWKPRDLGAPVVNATRSICAVHQNHDYAHVRGGVQYAHRGEEAQMNFDLAGGGEHMCSIHNATHRLINGKLKRDYIGSYFPRWTRAFVETMLKNFVDRVGPILFSLKRQRKLTR